MRTCAHREVRDEVRREAVEPAHEEGATGPALRPPPYLVLKDLDEADHKFKWLTKIQTWEDLTEDQRQNRIRSFRTLRSGQCDPPFLAPSDIAN